MGGKRESDFKQKKQNRGEEEKHVHLDRERKGEEKHAPEPLLVRKEQATKKTQDGVQRSTMRDTRGASERIR